MGRGGLDDDFARHFSTSGAASDLSEELESALACAEVGSVKGEVGIEDADEGDIGKVEPFGDHLGAEENIDLLRAEVAEGIAKGVFLAGGIGIESRDLCAFENFVEDHLGFFSSVALEADGGIAAFGAELGDDGLVTTNVTDESFLRAVVGERDGAVIALDDMTAGRTLKGAGEAAAVEEEDDLLIFFEALIDGGAELVGEDGVSAFLFSRFDPHVHDASERKGGAIGPFGEADDLIFTGFRVVKGLHRGCGRAKHNRAALESAAHDREIAGMILGNIFLFVGGLVFLIDDDKAKVTYRSKDGGAGADDDAGFSIPDSVPFIEAFSLGKIGVLHRNLVIDIREASLETTNGLGSQRDFRKENDDVFTKIEGFACCLQIDFSFSRSGDAEEEKRVRFFRFE